MNSITPHEDDVLARALRGQVDGMTQAPLTFEAITGRAGVIRRRRRAAIAGGVAAAVAAIAIPTAILSGGGLARSDEPQIATRGASPTAGVELKPVQGDLELSISGLAQGAAPRVGRIQDDVAVLSDGTIATLPALASTSADSTVMGVVELGEDLVLTTVDGSGDPGILIVTRGEGYVSDDRSTGEAVLSQDGTVAAYVRPDGTPVLLTDGGRTVQELPAVPAETPMIVAVTGSAPCAEGCSVWINDIGRRPAAYRVGATGATKLTAATRVAAVQGDRYLGRLEVKDDLTPVDGVFVGGARGPAWTVETSLTGFSPDGRWVVGQYSDGPGASELRILDAATGEPQVTWLRTTADGATALGEPVWEDDTHLVQVLSQGREVVIARFGLDGSMELTGVSQTVDDPIDATLSLIGG